MGERTFDKDKMPRPWGINHHRSTEYGSIVHTATARDIPKQYLIGSSMSRILKDFDILSAVILP